MESIIKKLGKTSVTVEKDYHSSKKEYNKLTIVEEEGTFKTYLSRKPVPIGTELTNREYWIPFSGVLESITFDYIKFKKDKPYEITKDGDTWVVTGKEIERLFNMTKFTEEEGVLRFGRILRAMGVEETLEKMGAKPGDDVAINDYLFTYKG